MAESIKIGATRLQSVLKCPLCFWLSKRIGSAPSIFPGIPAQIDSVIKNYMKQFIGSDNLPKWFPVRGTFIDASKTLRAIDSVTDITVVGKLDALAKTKDGNYHILDYKTGKPRDEVPDYYQMQLDGYAYLLERNGYRPVSEGVLLYFTPEQGDILEDSFPFRITAVGTKVDSSRIPLVLARAKEILELSTPPLRSEDCAMCMWLEQVGQTFSK